MRFAVRVLINVVYSGNAFSISPALMSLKAAAVASLIRVLSLELRSRSAFFR